ncbi:MAG TPA: hypothetical protein VKS44_13810 [Candidatus Acidoferrales bacterium]|nr:hypothetical protein [Candidatus Acidoferrales bacterium]
MEGQLDTPASTPVVEFNRCSADACAEPATTRFEARPLCVAHFIQCSMSAMEARNRELQSELWDPSAITVFRELLASCSARAKELLDSQETSPSPAKDRLLGLLLLISQLSQRLRRSPRFSKSVVVWLRREDPTQTWEEEAWTSSISRHGAGLTCRHRVEPGQTVFLCRKDKGGRARARIVYSHFDSAGDRQIGVELLDRDDFWEASELADLKETAPTATVQPDAPTRRDSPSATIRADVEIHVGSRTTRYNNVAFEVTSEKSEARLFGTIPDSLADLKIDPALLASLGAGDAPVRIEIALRKKR